MDACVDHLDFTDGVCPDCLNEVDKYGNTEYQFDYCSFPDCGCDGARLCMAKNGASDDAFDCNVEGMWSGKTKLHKRGVLMTVGLCAPKKKDNE